MVIAVILIAAGGFGVYYSYYRPSSTSSQSPSFTAGAFSSGQVVTFVYNGSATFECTPSLTALFPHDPNASGASGTTSCGAGNASQSAVPGQVPEWYLIPAYAGLSAFGLTGYNATTRGFPTVNGSAVLTDCGAGATPTACVDHPADAFSPFFAQFEVHAGLSSGVEGLPVGVLPFPAHDMVENYTSFPIVPWGTSVVFVLDPNILPDRATGVCAPVVVPSNLSAPLGNCLNSTAAIYAAATTCSSAAQDYNSAANNPIWWVLTHEDHVSPCAQVYVPSPGSLAPGGPGSGLNTNLYEPYSVQSGAPSSFPT